MISPKTALCGAGVSLLGASSAYFVLVLNGLKDLDPALVVLALVADVVGLVFLELGSCVQRAQDAARA